ncbi:MAG: ompJ [Actinobacteria bacterium]|nr:ompJ [Actinomycetota bacterium]
MRKGWMILLAMALVVALAVPASAEMKLNGFYRVKPTLSNYVGNGNNSLNVPGMEGIAATSLVKTGTSGIETDRARSFTEMRVRNRFEVGDENVKGVTFFELDGNFGDLGGRVGRNQGFASNGDSINLETKNAFVWFKMPNLPLEFTVGLQGYLDEFGGLLFGWSDQAGVVANYKADSVGLRFTWLKLRDDISVAGTGSTQNNWASSNPGGKEADYYAIDAKFVPSKDVNATLHFGAIYDRGIPFTFVTQPTEAAPSHTRLASYYVGANATFKFAPATLHGGFLYNFGSFTEPTETVDIGGYAVRLRADGNVGPGKAFLEGLYVSGDDNISDLKYKSIVTGSDYAALTSFYFSPDLTILFPNIDMINSATALVLNPNNGGRGLWLLAGGYSQKFTDRISAKVGAGYLAADKKRRSSTTTEAKGTGMGTEINGNVNVNLAKGLDFGVYGAYCFLGNFYDRDPAQAQPLDLYTLFGRLNFAF